MSSSAERSEPPRAGFAPFPPTADLTREYDGVPVAVLAERFGIPELRAYAAVSSTMDLAHTAAVGGAPAGTTIVADVQTAGRGRNGRGWTSAAGAGVWATLVQRPRDLEAVSVLSLRVGLALAAELDVLLRDIAPVPVALKWPNDILLEGRKLAGILVEARWRERVPEWVAIGVGVNRRPPSTTRDAIGTGDVVRLQDLLGAVVRAVHSASAHRGTLRAAELATFATRDAIRGREVLSPVPGMAAGVNARGELLVRSSSGEFHAVPTATVEYRASPS